MKPWEQSHLKIRKMADPEGFAPWWPSARTPQPTGCSADRATSPEMVGSAGNAPVVASGLFDDTAFTGRQPDHYPKWLRGLELHPRRQSLWGSPESHSPRSEMVESVGNAPTSACLQSRCIACLPRPRTMAGRLGAAPSGLGFGDPVARAGARPAKETRGLGGSVN